MIVYQNLPRVLNKLACSCMLEDNKYISGLSSAHSNKLLYEYVYLFSPNILLRRLIEKNLKQILLTCKICWISIGISITF